MASLEQMREAAEEVVASYVTRLTTVSQIIDETYGLLNNSRVERAELETALRDILAETSSLRKKDFDEMMADIMEQQNRREAAIRDGLRRFLDEQVVLANRLKNELKSGNIELIRSIQASIEKGLSETKQFITDVHNEEQMLIRRLKILVKMGPQLKVQEFKKAIKDMRENLMEWDA